MNCAFDVFYVFDLSKGIKRPGIGPVRLLSAMAYIHTYVRHTLRCPHIFSFSHQSYLMFADPKKMTSILHLTGSRRGTFI